MSVSTEQTAFGDKVVSTTRTAMGLNESLATHLKEFADATPGRRVASQPLQAIQSTLDAARSGWRVCGEELLERAAGTVGHDVGDGILKGAGDGGDDATLGQAVIQVVRR